MSAECDPSEPLVPRRPTVSIVVAMSLNRVIGKDNRIPWSIPSDLARFRSMTMGHTIIMGRETHEAIGRPLPGRRNIVLTRQRDYSAPGCLVVHSLACALQQHLPHEEEVFVIGGAQIYAETLPFTDRIYLTTVHRNVCGNAYFPELPLDEFRQIESVTVEGPDSYTFSILERIKSSTSALQEDLGV